MHRMRWLNLFPEPVGGIYGLSGVIHSYDLSKASVADLHYMKDVKHTWMKSIKHSDLKNI